MTIMTPESTAVCWFSYDDVNHRLTVGFHDQTSYVYTGVPERVFTLLSSAISRQVLQSCDPELLPKPKSRVPRHAGPSQLVIHPLLLS
jgi:hypothetical protein